ncbi:hypothetical protein QYF36_019833 [Acer negundo]|nr:hypothetical protein QYF36_019833 [Acer negundo]
MTQEKCMLIDFEDSHVHDLSSKPEDPPTLLFLIIPVITVSKLSVITEFSSENVPENPEVKKQALAMLLVLLSLLPW